MYSIFLHFAAILIDLSTCYVYFSNEYWVLGATTSLVTLFPLLTGGWLFYTGWTQRRQATIIIGFLHSGAQLLLQLTLLIRFWHYLKGVLVSFGTLYSPQWVIIVISCISSTLVLAKSTRECHFLCQAPSRPPLLTASFFRAGLFFGIHAMYRGLALATVLAYLPLWGCGIILLIFLITNFLVALFVFKFPYYRASLTSFTALMTPSVFPVSTPTPFPTLNRFHIINSATTTALIFTLGLFTAFLSTPNYVWPLLGGAFSCCPAEILAEFQNKTIGNKVVGIDVLPKNISEMVPGPTCGPNEDPLWTLQHVALPMLAIGGLLYVVIIIIVMGIIQPSWIKSPYLTSPTASTDTAKDSAYDSSNPLVPPPPDLTWPEPDTTNRHSVYSDIVDGRDKEKKSLTFQDVLVQVHDRKDRIRASRLKLIAILKETDI